jgi:pectinesterase
MHRWLLTYGLIISGVQAFATSEIVVAAHGGGDFRSIQEALNSISSHHTRPVLILIRSGLYNEKLFIRRSHVTLVGEGMDSTRIVFPELRENWTREHEGSDWGAGVVNIDTGVTDITIANMTIYNNYGWKHKVFNKHQFGIRGAGTRIMLLYCRVRSDGGDAVSLWNADNGMYYHAHCEFEGWVDFVCPRGWCYVTDSKFFGHNLSASLWHDGSRDKSQKFVIRNSSFDGVPGFPLGRHHRDAQFYLVECRFSERMADRPMYFPGESPNARPWVWGPRHYYYRCTRDGGDFAWFRDNLETAFGSPSPDEITAQWTYDGKWDPECNMPSILPFASFPTPRSGRSKVSPASVRLAWVAARGATSYNVHFGTSNPPQRQGNQLTTVFEAGRLAPAVTYFWRVDVLTEQDTTAGRVWSFTTE